MCLRLAIAAVLWSRAGSTECPLDEGLSFLATRATAKPRATAATVLAWNASNDGPYYDPLQDFIDSWEPGRNYLTAWFLWPFFD